MDRQWKMLLEWNSLAVELARLISNQKDILISYRISRFTYEIRWESSRLLLLLLLWVWFRCCRCCCDQQRDQICHTAHTTMIVMKQMMIMILVEITITMNCVEFFHRKNPEAKIREDIDKKTESKDYRSYRRHFFKSVAFE